MIYIKRYKAIFFVTLAIVFALSLKILKLNISDSQNFKKIIATQSSITKPISPVRLTVCDRNMIPLTDRTKATRYIDKYGIINENTGTPFRAPLRIERNQIAMHILGYSSSDGTGLCGIEKKYDSILKTGLVSSIEYKANAAGAPTDKILPSPLSNGEPKSCLKLTLDYHIQKITENALKEFIPKGAAVILDAENFDIISMASVPLYDLNEPDAEDEGQFLNRALCGYNAGSVFKIITTAAALEKESQYFEKKFFCEGKFTGDGIHVFGCNKQNGHGEETLTEAFASSCNCAFYETALNIGAQDIIGTAFDFGLGKECLNMAGEESAGNIPLKDIYTANEAINLSIGQGEIMITPLQCAVMCATVANKGVRKNVNITSGIYNRNVKNETSLRNDSSLSVISPQTASQIASMMRECAVSGTASEAGLSQCKIAGKTGSAESGWIAPNGESAVHGWFCGFFPYDNPKYAMAIICENGRSGAQSCIKPFIKICEEINKIYPFIQ